jgi:hypothetical protein
MYYIEKQIDEQRMWWDGDNWTDIDTDAMAYHKFQKDCAEAVADEVGGTVKGFE